LVEAAAERKREERKRKERRGRGLDLIPLCRFMAWTLMGVVEREREEEALP
jgi:hypothetical protein